jgi:hypothetical protein
MSTSTKDASFRTFTQLTQPHLCNLTENEARRELTEMTAAPGL